MTQTIIITMLVIIAAALIVLLVDLQDYNLEDELDTPKEDKEHESTQHRSPG
jgi:hypothetical protein